MATIITGRTPPMNRVAFRYFNRGMLATIGRAKAVAQFGSIHVSGLAAWLLWCTVHIFF